MLKCIISHYENVSHNTLKEVQVTLTFSRRSKSSGLVFIMVVYEDTFQLHFEACINNQYIYSKIILYNYVIYKGDPSDI